MTFHNGEDATLSHGSKRLLSKLQAAVIERDRLTHEQAEAAEEYERHKSGVERQSEVIQQLMAQSEELQRDSQRLSSERDAMYDDNHALKVNLNTHSAVIEKLIHLNTELMDAANAAKRLLEQRGHPTAPFIPVPSSTGAAFTSQLPPLPPHAPPPPTVAAAPAASTPAMPLSMPAKARMSSTTSLTELAHYSGGGTSACPPALSQQACPSHTRSRGLTHTKRHHTHQPVHRSTRRGSRRSAHTCARCRNPGQLTQ